MLSDDFGHTVQQKTQQHARQHSLRNLGFLLRLGWTMAGLVVAKAGPALAAGSNMPWETPLQAILDSIEGPVARIIAVIIIIITGLSLAFGDTAGGFRRLIQIVFGLSIAFAATSFFLTFFSFGGGALIS
jgi:type IV secretory pathway VirB2 component (pilin)